jgi:membrane protease YdiL (CAAX protease family)
VAFALQAVRWRETPQPVWAIAGTFLGFLWVIALSEEFLLWGVLREWVEEWRGSRAVAVAICSVIFGLVHLPFGGAGRFPNWRWAFVAAVLGLFVGRARNQAGGIRAGVVTHALAVATWRGFFSS